MTRRLALLFERPYTGPGFDYTLDLVDKLLAHAGLSRRDCFVGYLTEPDLMTRLAAWQPHFLLLWEEHGALLRAFSAPGGRRKVDDWAGYVWRTEAGVPGVKCLATYAPQRITKDWGLTGVVKFHLSKAGRELGTDELVVPRRDIFVCMPD